MNICIKKNSHSPYWESKKDQSLDAKTLQMLFDNKIPAIRIPGFLKKYECQKVRDIIEKHGEFQSYTYKEDTEDILKIGPAQCEYGLEKFPQYFKDADEHRAFLEQLSQENVNLVDRVRYLLSDTQGRLVQLAKENSIRKNYSAGVVRDISSSALLHVDWAPYDAPGWEIGKVESQITWNVYIKPPQAGGASRVYSDQWQPYHEIHKVKGSYHYDEHVILNSEEKINPVREGDLVLFNSRNFHSVDSSVGKRLTMSSFVGRKYDGSMVMWS